MVLNMISRTIRQFYARGLHQLVKPTMTASQAFPYQKMSVRQFSTSDQEEGEDQGRVSEDVDDAPQAAEPEPTPAAAASAGAPDMAAATKPPVFDAVAADLFQPFDLGNIKKVDSTPDHQPPSKEDTIEGRYAGVLFTYASTQEQLYAVYEDVKYLQALFAHCESFRLFTENQGVGKREI